MHDNIRPKIRGKIPTCADECKYSIMDLYGLRCRLQYQHIGGVCVPAIENMAEKIETLTAKMEERGEDDRQDRD